MAYFALITRPEMPPPKIRILAGWACMAVLLSGCFASQGRWSGYSRVHDVRSSYTSLWQDRQAKFAEKIALLKPRENEPSSILIERNSYKAIVDTLQGFKEFRRSGTVLSAAFSWIKKEFGSHIVALRATGAGPDSISLLDNGYFAPVAENLGRENAHVAAYHYGAMKELQTLAKQLSVYRQKYVSAFRKDKAEEPPDRPPSTVYIDTIMKAVQAGVKAANGR